MKDVEQRKDEQNERRGRDEGVEGGGVMEKLGFK